MVYDLAMLKAFYTLYEGKIERIRTILQRPLTLAEKILYAHLYDEKNVKDYKRGEDYVNFRPTVWLCRMQLHRWHYYSL
mgnify:FL=1